MYKQENIKPYTPDGDKSTQVAAMFDHIAPTYDTLNHRMSFNIDRWWRKRAVEHLRAFRPRIILDVASGTGDFALMMGELLNPQHILATDISEQMMKVGKQKVKDKGMADIITFQYDNCMQLSLADNTFDAVTATFGIRNFPDLEKGLREMCRVMKKGGQLCILELSTPKKRMMRALFKLYSHTILPLYGRFVARDKSAYTYLTKTIEGFPQAETMMRILQKAGFSKPAFKRLTFGICTLYTASK